MRSAIVSKGIFQSKPMNNQQAFARVWQRFIVEKAPIALIGSTCVYRVGPDHGCAVGVQMPDALYKRELEGITAYQLLVAVNPVSSLTREKLDVAEIRAHFDRVAPALMLELQQAHDSTSNGAVYDFAVKLVRIAQDFGLDIPGGAA